tara:strand:- start:4104 stop:4334 length:231 start_codon:yes stop_codon:yes gene_type:complete
MKKNKSEIIYYLANKYNMPLKNIEEIINYQFKYISNVMETGKFESIRLPYFGKFSVNPNRVKHLTSLKNKKTNDKR